ncbi:hydroxyethylthiazole kinase [Knoellia subterranea]|uniref:Hydroxyethylthiazole kinase n=1 Tax=Knoellia subterranea KCTC 19937 TaxID=1385521 RepID=A0A0A0JII0_9MICO|nr:hydroxyethylthiazole kinase [Knoellia subterranea]KGN37215.1 hydroxyethylthiazole kinase [Knoellia subterranea KCTC 19937]
MTDPTDLRREVALAISRLRDRAPLVHAITGSATQGLVADGLLAAGARPMLTSTLAEAPTLVRGANSLLVNLGSLSTDAREAAVPTVQQARADGIPWVLDPTAIGVAPIRTPLARELVARRPIAVRGNASEILALWETDSRYAVRGPDSTASPDAAIESAKALARAHGCVVAVSGPVDVVTDGVQVVRVANGRSLLTRVSGTGCLLGALTAASVVGASSVLGAVVAATALLTCAADRTSAAGPGSFRIELLDALAEIGPDEVAEAVDLRCE